MSAAAELKPLVKSLNSASTDEVRYGFPYDVPVHLHFLPLWPLLTLFVLGGMCRRSLPSLTPSSSRRRSPRRFSGYVATLLLPVVADTEVAV